MDKITAKPKKMPKLFPEFYEAFEGLLMSITGGDYEENLAEFFKDPLEAEKQKQYDLEFLDKCYLRAKDTGLNFNFRYGMTQDEAIFCKEFWNWMKDVKNNPKYMKDVFMIGGGYGYPISEIKDSMEHSIEVPLREACKILWEKGYVTDYSSGNYQDSGAGKYPRTGWIIPNKNVAFIRIDTEGIPEEVSAKLFNKEATYGYEHVLYCEVTPDSLVSEVSKNLADQAKELPAIAPAAPQL